MPADEPEYARDLMDAFWSELDAIEHRIAALNLGAPQSSDEWAKLEARIQDVVREANELSRPSLQLVQGGVYDAR